MKLSLRLFLTSVTALICLCGAITGGTFWYSNKQNNKATQSLVDAVESLAVTQELQQSLATHRRQALLKGLRPQFERKAKIHDSEEQILAGVGRLSDFVGSPEEAAVVERVHKAISNYIKAYNSFRDQGLRGSDLYQHVTLAYDTTEEAIQELIQINLVQTKDIEDNLQTEAHLNTVLMSFILALLGLLVGLLIYGSRKLLYLPILKLKNQIDRFEIGKMDSTKSVPSGAREIQAIFKSFLEMSDRLSKQKDQQLTFLSSIAHDLKNPLSAIKMSAEVLSLESDQNQQILSIISRQSEHLNRLVGDLLDTTRIEAGNFTLKMEPFDLARTVQDLIRLYQNLSDRHVIETKLPSHPVTIVGDEQRIIQVINNLFSNAIKYSPQGGTIQVNVSIENGSVLFSISDQGLGILAEEIDGIFQPFRRSSSTKDLIPGVGLGLSVARKIVNAHAGGNLSVVSEPGKGSTFILKLQLAQPAKVLIKNSPNEKLDLL